MKEQGLFFTPEQIELLKEIEKLESTNNEIIDDRKRLTVIRRIEMCELICQDYSLLKSKKGILQSQLFSVMHRLFIFHLRIILTF